MPKPSVKFFANGKLLLTAEYFVLHGAKALAMPVKFGQSLLVSPSPDNYSGIKNKDRQFQSRFLWQSYYLDRPWFSAEFESEDFGIIKSSNQQVAKTLVRIFESLRELNPQFRVEAGTEVKTILEFDPAWGLGSSSSLISCMADWAGVDPFLLNEKVFNGSGFDIACARADDPVFYIKGREPEIIGLEYPFEENLFFIYSGKKQNTRDAIRAKNLKVSKAKKDKISALSEQIAFCDNLKEFQELIKIHEEEVACLIDQKPVQKQFFSDFKGTIKSLGAWGGDFFLIATEWDFQQAKKYFSEKGMTEIFRWKEMVW